MLHRLIVAAIALVWLINGLYCKCLNRVPRHQAIVARILGERYARVLTLFIGLLEIAMAVWVFSGIEHRFNAIIQAVLILSMNVIEFWKARDLLLFGRLNLLFAILFVALILSNEFMLLPNGS
jgi:hypothetical protein